MLGGYVLGSKEVPVAYNAVSLECMTNGLSDQVSE